MNRIRFVLESRGVWNSVERLRQVASRFGLTASRMERRLLSYQEILAAHGSHPSLPITARVMARNPDVARRLLDKGVELCVHGLVHNDLSRLSAGDQAGQIDRACGLFRKHGIPYSGFRSPYLKYNKDTLRAVEAAGFDYDSNLPFYWDPSDSLSNLGPGEKDGLERGLAFYQPATRTTDRSLPRLVGKLVEIPVSLPDDEILLDRMNLDPPSVGRTWLEMLDSAARQGEMLTLQLHPERVEILGGALSALLDTAVSRKDIWLATLAEVARWWRGRAGSDISVTAAGGDQYAVARSGAASDLFVVEPSSKRASLLSPGRNIVAPRKPLIGLHPETGPALRIKVREAGYFFEDAADSSAYPVFFGPADVPDDRFKGELERCNLPLVRENIWPSSYRAAVCVSGDIDCLTLGDFARRAWEG